ncbi:DnaJ-domain-containing protein [Saitoella complicata NRRL Y-17804]|uniref:DnaJ-domain-containing protein n=1 Tax=Saitoella complicata (strain BCRC 22490 / CBS 7301 / JCM 7358 / NBRC 10748 / NRRL Y-17804) TaxID=698492 RepID=UPI0008669754|nr:DnaJ-domain-containing protein [Saitoella complicata NRRL Y-17804]ODQ55303.1 DnaJ-domain-containing protein [Saitoella complicata NRRL Y-17804]
MRLTSIFCVFAVVFATLVAAWTEADYEIFDLAASLETHEGPGTTFYSFLKVPKSADLEAITKAYRKRSLALHPDKNRGKKGAHERFARLGVVTQILRDGEKRARYDHFLNNGFPRWRGTGYYYSRFRPGLGSVLLGLLVAGSAAQYGVHVLVAKQNRGRLERHVREARGMAWASSGGLPNGRKMKVTNPETGHAFVVDGKSGDVFYVDDFGEEHFVDVNEVEGPSFKRTMLVQLPKLIWRKTIGGWIRRPDEEGEPAFGESETEDGEVVVVKQIEAEKNGSGTSTPKETKVLESGRVVGARKRRGGKK